jgi:tight adherence protein C
VFLATAIGLTAMYIWWESRKESLPRRVEEVTLAAGEQPVSFTEKMQGRIDRVRSAIYAKTPFGEEEIQAIVTGRQLSGGRLLLNQAGYRTMHAYKIYWVARILLPVAMVALGYGFANSLAMSPKRMSLFVGALLLLGIFLPDFFLRRKAAERREAVSDALPAGLDLLVVCIEAGLGINAAFMKITEEFQIASPVLSEEFDIVNREMAAGKPRIDALRSLSERTGVEDVKSLVAMLIQTEKLGTSLAQSLRVHSDSLRTKRRQRAEEAAAKTTVKLILPLVLMLFPALFVVLLGPGFIQIFRVLIPGVK